MYGAQQPTIGGKVLIYLNLPTRRIVWVKNRRDRISRFRVFGPMSSHPVDYFFSPESPVGRHSG